MRPCINRPSTESSQRCHYQGPLARTRFILRLAAPRKTIIRNLKTGRNPESKWIANLHTVLREGLVGATKFTNSQNRPRRPYVMPYRQSTYDRNAGTITADS
jgi:hypothetical protein